MGRTTQDTILGITEELCPEGPGGQHQGVPSLNSDPTPNPQCDDAHFTDQVTEAQGGEGSRHLQALGFRARSLHPP